MKTAKITIHPDFRISEVDRRLFGAFLEPIENWVYGAIYQPEHESSDDRGFRGDMLSLIRELGLPAVRLPGGNVISGWDWKDSIGPKENRKAHLDLAWREVDSNHVGHDEYLLWAERAGAEALYTLNLGTGTIESAKQCIEYTVFPEGSYWSDLRRSNGFEKPHDVKVWYLGNEMDSPWQIHSWEKDPTGYGNKAHETAKIVKWLVPDGETVVCGTSTKLLSVYPEWERKVLEECYETTDYLSVHYYHYVPEGDVAAFMSTSDVVEEVIRTELAVCDYVQAEKSDPRKIMLSVDEFGSYFKPQKEVEVGRRGRIPHESIHHLTKEDLARPFRITSEEEFVKPAATEVGEEYLWALASSSVMLMLLRHADRVKIACAAALLAGGAISYDASHVWKSAAFYPFAQMIRYGSGISLMPAVSGPTFRTEAYKLNGLYEAPSYEGLQCVEAAAVHNEEKQELTVFLINRDVNDSISIEMDLRGFEDYEFECHSELFTDDIHARSAYGNEIFVPALNRDTEFKSGKIKAVLKKLSWNMIRLKRK